MFIAPVLGVEVLADGDSGGGGDAEVCGENTTGTDGVRQISRAHWPASLAKLVSFRFSEKFSLKNQVQCRGPALT